MKKIGVIGMGRLGLAFALSLERSGFEVWGSDLNQKRLEKIRNKELKSPEPFVEKYISKNKNLSLTTNNCKVAKFSEVCFVIVRTPSKPGGGYDHSQVDSVLDDVESLKPKNKPEKVAICSTVMPGYTDKVASQIQSDLFYNPEFIAQGNIIDDQENPDLVLVGSPDGEKDEDLHHIYNKMTKNSPSFHFMDRKSAEIAKIALNCFCTTKISFANMVGDLVKEVGHDPNEVLDAIGDDSRVGHEYLNYGFGYGGPCFPRDNRALAKAGESFGVDMPISKATDEMNEQHLDNQIGRFVQKYHPDNTQVVFKGEHIDKTRLPNSEKEKVVLEPITYKPAVDILKESQQLEFAKRIADIGYEVVVADTPETIQQLHSENFKFLECKN